MVKSLLVTIAVLVSLGNSNCATETLNTRAYRIRNERGGVYRGQADELIPFADAEGMYVFTEEDMRKISEFIAGCRN